MEEISKQFMSLYPVKDMNFEDIFSVGMDYDFCIQMQTEIIAKTVMHPRCKEYPPHTKYCSSFLRTLIMKLEGLNLEVGDEVYNRYTELLSSSDGDCTVTYRTYTLPSSCLMTLKENTSLIAQGTTGLRTWQASHVLFNHLLRGDIIHGKRVVELGCGAGHLGLSLLIEGKERKMEPLSYAFTDCHPSVMKALKENLLINLGTAESADDSCWIFSSSKVYMKPLDWEDEQPQLNSNLVIAADVVFDPRLHLPLLNTIQSLLSDGGVSSSAVLALTIRNEDALQDFLNQIDDCCLRVTANSEESYREAPSKPQDRVKIIHLELKQ